MFRANRLKQIAEANQNVFSSNSDAQWWLAEATPKAAPAKSAAPTKSDATPLPAQPLDLKAEAPMPVERRIERPAPEPQYVPLVELSSVQAGEETPAADSRSAFDDDLVWDAKAGCFVRMAVPVAH